MRTRRDVYEMIFAKLTKLYKDLESLKPGDYIKFQSDGFMDLHLDVLSKEGSKMEIALAHNYQVNGDTVPDPDMMIRLYLDMKSAEALTYQDSFGFQQVYPTPTTFYPSLKKDLNRFLNKWLTNIDNQQFKISVEKIQSNA